MAFNATKMQQKAIETRGNVLVSAAAGSGKTAVLVERVIGMLTDRVNPISADRLLIVTFTNAAAAEMRTRIEKRLNEEIQKNPQDVGLLKQRYLLSSADICTIDSFCIKLVRENFEKCGIEPDFKILESSKEYTISRSVMSELFGSYLSKNPAAMGRLLELTGCEYDEKNLTDIIEQIHIYSNLMPFPFDFLDGLLRPYQAPFEKGNVWYDGAFEYAREQLEYIQKRLAQMQAAAGVVNKNTEKYASYASAAQLSFEALVSAYESGDWDTFYNALIEFNLGTVPSADKDDENANIFKENKAQALDIIRKKISVVFYADSKTVAAEIAENYPAAELLIDMVKSYGSMLFERFREENAFTFYNIEQLAFNLLCEKKDGKSALTELSRELSKRYKEVLVDEFQDVNDLQNMLFYALSDCEKNLFVVGDAKQSIYGFRGANPENFINKKNSYIPIESALENDAKKITLQDNFRSRKGVCDAVNYFFSLFLCGQCGELVYDDGERLNASGSFPQSDNSCCELLFVKKEADDGKTLMETEAEKLAEYILSTMQEGEIITDGDTLRKPRYSDFAILLDKAKSSAPVIAQTLSDYGIPVTLGGDAFLESYEIATVMSLLQVIDNPKNDIELLGVMMSPLYCFTADEMAVIRAKHKKGSLYSAVVAAAQNGDDRVEEFLQKISGLRREAASIPLDRLISKILHSTDILNQMSAMSGGRVRRANLLALIGYAKGYSDSFGGGIYGFIKYMRSLPESSFKVSVAGGEDGVRIMTMHASKGLQFPICIIAALFSMMNKQEVRSPMLFGKDSGIAFSYYDEKRKEKTEMFGHKIMQYGSNSKIVQEKMRLLYVAMTRAIDRLCLVYSCKDPEKSLANTAKDISAEMPYLSREFLEKKQNMGDWIIAAMLLHPSGDTLRFIADSKLKAIASASVINVKTVSSEDSLDIQKSKDEQIGTAKANDDLVLKIKQNLDYAYPYERLQSLQAKSSVSAIVHAAENDSFAFSEKPNFMLKDSLSAAGRGTAMHNFMQFVNYTDLVDVASEAERMVEWQFITEAQANALDAAALDAFFKSDIYKRILSSNDVHREMRFLTELSANKIDSTIDIDDSEAKIIVQGAVDLCFEEPDGIVVLDFKTDRVDTLDRLVECYGEQLEIYATAAEKIFQKPVKEKIIYSFSLGNWIVF